MTAPDQPQPDHPQPVPPADAPADPLRAGGTRWDGWTPGRQRRFLELVAEGHVVDAACRAVGLSPASAYALRRRAAGAAFALGWDAARLLARDRFADALTARAFEGQEEVLTRADGSVVTRHRYDNRLALAVLARLDRYADAADGTAPGQAARLAAQDFEAYCDTVEADEGPAAAARFLDDRLDEVDDPLDPVAALDRADAHARPDDEGTEDGKADAPDEDASTSQLSQPTADALPPPAFSHQGEGPPVWRCERRRGWYTRFPPPPGERAVEHGRYGESGYERELTADERRRMTRAAEVADRLCRERDGRHRDAWFAEMDGLAAGGGSAAPGRAA